MPLPIRWSVQAKADAVAYRRYLKSAWAPKVSQTFRERLKRVLSIIAQNPEAFAVVDGTVRKVMVDRHMALYYRPVKGAVQLIRLYHGSRNPDDLRL